MSVVVARDETTAGHLVFPWPNPLPWGAEVVCAEHEVAIICPNFEVGEKLGPGRHTINPQTQQPGHILAYFINIAPQLVAFERYVSVHDRSSNQLVPVRFFGSAQVKVGNPLLMCRQVVGLPYHDLTTGIVRSVQLSISQSFTRVLAKLAMANDTVQNLASPGAAAQLVSLVTTTNPMAVAVTGMELVTFEQFGLVVGNNQPVLWPPPEVDSKQANAAMERDHDLDTPTTLDNRALDAAEGDGRQDTGPQEIIVVDSDDDLDAPTTHTGSNPFLPISEFTSEPSGEFSGEFTGEASGEFTGELSGEFTGERSGEFTGDPQPAGRENTPPPTSTATPPGGTPVVRIGQSQIGTAGAGMTPPPAATAPNGVGGQPMSRASGPIPPPAQPTGRAPTNPPVGPPAAQPPAAQPPMAQPPMGRSTLVPGGAPPPPGPIPGRTSTLPPGGAPPPAPMRTPTHPPGGAPPPMRNPMHSPQAGHMRNPNMPPGMQPRGMPAGMNHPGRVQPTMPGRHPSVPPGVHAPPVRPVGQQIQPTRPGARVQPMGPGMNPRASNPNVVPRQPPNRPVTPVPGGRRKTPPLGMPSQQPQRVTPPPGPYQIGTQVLVYWNDGLWHSATIRAFNGTAYQVTIDGRNAVTWVQASQMRRQ